MATKKPARAVKQAVRRAPRSTPRAARQAKAPSLTTAAARPQAEACSLLLTVNGQRHELPLGRDLDAGATLAYVLRDRLGFTGLKVACDEGACGGCTVLLDGRAVLSCMMLAVEAQGHEILTIEGLPQDDPVVQAFAAQCAPGYGTALQCGFCTPGFVMSTTALLAETPRPTIAEIKEGLSGHICRCGCYAGIAQAVLHAAEQLAARGGRS